VYLHLSFITVFSPTSMVVRPIQSTSTIHSQCRASQSSQRVSSSNCTATDVQDCIILKILVESSQSKSKTRYTISIADIADYHQEYLIHPMFSSSLETVYENGTSDLEIKSVCA
jgi:hypothetical protein